MAKTDKKSEKEESEEDQFEDMRRSGLRWMSIGVEFCTVVVLCTLLGHWLDGKADTSPGFMIMFFLIGFGTMIYIMIKRAGGLKW